MPIRFGQMTLRTSQAKVANLRRSLELLLHPTDQKGEGKTT